MSFGIRSNVIKYGPLQLSSHPNEMKLASNFTIFHVYDLHENYVTIAEFQNYQVYKKNVKLPGNREINGESNCKRLMAMPTSFGAAIMCGYSNSLRVIGVTDGIVNSPSKRKIRL
jgi:hypothetical protein